MPVLKSAPLAQEFFSFNPGQLFAELALSATARGASKIRIHTTDDGFFLSDDGEPIPDLASLFQSAEQADTWLLALLACCRRVRIVSGAQQLDVLSRDAFVQNVFARPAEVRCDGRMIEVLGLHASTYGEIEHQVRWLSRGFPIAIEFNSKPLRRVAALDNGLVWHDTAIGQVCFPEGLARCNVRDGLTAYLDGLSVTGAAHATVLVHLDPAQFKARMLDRSKLASHPGRVEIEAAVRELIQNELRRILRENDERFLICNFWDCALRYLPALLVGCRELPTSLGTVVEEVQADDRLACHHRSADMPTFHYFDRGAVERGEVRVAIGDYLANEERTPGSTIGLMYCKYFKYCIIPDEKLPPGHWLFEVAPRVDKMATAEFIDAELAVGAFELDSIHFTLNLCQAIVLDGRCGKVRVLDELVQLADIPEDGDDLLGYMQLWSPAKTPVKGRGIEQACRFESGKQDLQAIIAWRDNCMRIAMREVLNVRQTDACELLGTTLGALVCPFSSLEGRRFVVRIQGRQILVDSEIKKEEG